MSLTVWQIDPAQITQGYDLALCEGLAEAGCDVTYVATKYLYADSNYPPSINLDLMYFRGVDADWLNEYPTVRRLLRGLIYPVNHWQLYRKIRAHKPDIVHFQWSRLPRFDLTLIRAIQNLGIPVVHTVHDIVPLYEDGDMSRLFDIYRQCDQLIVHSEANQQTLMIHVPDLRPEKVYQLPLVDVRFSRPLDVSQASAREKLGIAQDTFVLLFFGGVKTYKGVDILLDAMRQLADLAPNIVCLIVGKAGDSIHQAYLDTMKTMDNMIVVDSYVPDDDVWAYQVAADVAVLPYRHIFQSSALITMMSFGLPVIATDVGALPETIDGNGVIIPSEDAEVLVEAILEASSDWDIEILGKRSQEIVAKRHDYSLIGKQQKAYYERLLAR